MPCPLTVGKESGRQGIPDSSDFARLGSHPARADGVDAVARQDARTGDSGFARLGSHLAEVGAAEGRARQGEGPGSSGNAGTCSHLAEADAAESHARAGCGCGGRATGGLTAGRHTSGTFGQSSKRASPARPAKAAQQPGKISHEQGKTRRAGQATINAGRRYFFRWPLWSLQRP